MSQIKINTVDITTGNYILNEIRFDDAPPIQFSELPFASADGSKFISSRYTPKTITMRGRISGTSQVNLETNIDTFKKSLLEDQNINLNCSYAGGFRQWIGNVSQLSITREHFNITVAFFDITFSAQDPFAYDISTIDADPAFVNLYSADNFSGNQLSHTFTCDGSAPPQIKWTYLLDSVSGQMSQMVFKSLTGGKQLEINSVLSAGDQIIINQEELEVLLNGQPYNYEGVFPEFNIGANEFEWDVYGSGGSGLVLDQIFVDGHTRNWLYDRFDYFGQTFTAEKSGQLRFQFNLSKYSTFNDFPLTLEFKLWNTSGGSPTTEIETISKTLDSLSSSEWVELNFSSSVTSGTQDGVTITCNSLPLPSILIIGNNNIYGTSSYDSGTMIWKDRSSSSWYQWTPYDLNFKSYIYISGFNHSSDLKIQYKKRYV